MGEGEDGVAVLGCDVQHGLSEEGHGGVLVLGGEQVEVRGKGCVVMEVGEMERRARDYAICSWIKGYISI